MERSQDHGTIPLIREDQETREPVDHGTKRSQPGPYGFTHMQGNEEFEPMEDGPEWVHRDTKRGRWLTAVNVRQMGLFREEEVDKVEGLVDKWLKEVKEVPIEGDEGDLGDLDGEAWDDVKGGELPLDLV